MYKIIGLMLCALSTSAMASNTERYNAIQQKLVDFANRMEAMGNTVVDVPAASANDNNNYMSERGEIFNKVRTVKRGVDQACNNIKSNPGSIPSCEAKLNDGLNSLSSAEREMTNLVTKQTATNSQNTKPTWRPAPGTTKGSAAVGAAPPKPTLMQKLQNLKTRVVSRFNSIIGRR